MKKPRLEDRTWTGHLNLSSHSSFSFLELNKVLDANEYSWWRVLIFLSQELQTQSNLSLARNILLAIQLCKNNIKRTNLLWGLRQVLGSNNYEFPENQIWHTDNSSLSQKEKVSFFLCQSSFSEWVQQSPTWPRSCNKNIMFLQFPEKFRARELGLLSINFGFRNIIFQPMVFPFVWAKYKWKFMRTLQALLSLALYSLAQIGEPARG